MTIAERLYQLADEVANRTGPTITYRMVVERAIRRAASMADKAGL